MAVASEPSDTVFSLSKFTSRTDPQLDDNDYQTIEEKDFTSDEGKAWAFGIGKHRNPDKAEAYVYAEVYDCSGSQITNGDLRAAVRTQSGRVLGEFFNFDMASIDRGETTRKDRQPLPAKTFRGMDGKQKRYAANPRTVTLDVRLEDGASAVNYDPDNSNNKVEIDGKKLEA